MCEKYSGVRYENCLGQSAQGRACCPRGQDGSGVPSTAGLLPAAAAAGGLVPSAVSLAAEAAHEHNRVNEVRGRRLAQCFPTLP